MMDLQEGLRAVMGPLAERFGLAPGAPSLSGELCWPLVRVSDGRPVMDVVIRELDPADPGGAYARTSRFLLRYSLCDDAGRAEDLRRTVTGVMDGIAVWLRASEHDIARFGTPASAGEAAACAPIGSPDALSSADLPTVLESAFVDPPEHILRVDYRCNQRCPFCFVRLQPFTLSPDAAERYLGTVPAAQRAVSDVVLSGGEPTLNPRLLDVVAVARDMGFMRIKLQTNGVMLSDPARVEGLVAAGIRSFFVSLHSHVESVYDVLTGTHGQFFRAVQGLSNLLAHPGTDVGINHVLTRRNVADLEAFVVFVGDLAARLNGRTSLFFTLMNEWGHVKAPELAVGVDDLRPHLDRAVVFCRDIGLRVEPFSGHCAPPLCAVRAGRGVAQEGPVPRDFAIYVADFDGLEPHQRVKAPGCAACALDDRCFGVTAAYAQRFGLEGLVPA